MPRGRPTPREIAVLLVLGGCLQSSRGAVQHAGGHMRGTAHSRPRSARCSAAEAPKPRGDGLPCGSLAALVTPMDEDGSVQETQLRELLQWHLSSGTDGLVVLGTTAEASMLSAEERSFILRVTQEEVSGRLPVIVGTGTIDPKTVIRNGEEASKWGADGVLVVTPYYVKPTQKGLVQHFESIADASPLPMILYNVPGRTGVDMTPITIGQLSEHPRIAGVKVRAPRPRPHRPRPTARAPVLIASRPTAPPRQEATGDVLRVAPLRELCGPNFLLYSGDDATAVDFVLAGGDGSISVTTNVAPSTMREIMACARIGDAARARELNAQLELLHRRLFLQSNPIPVKWALNKMGRVGPGIRAPLTPLESEFHSPLLEAMDVAGLR